MSWLEIILILIGSFCLGSIPLTSYIVKLLTGKKLNQLGTENISVSAAFLHGGKLAGITAVVAEASRGILPVVITKIYFPEYPALQILGLIFLVLGRYAIAKGGGVTNITWGVLIYSPKVLLASAITGLLIWYLGKNLSLHKSYHKWRLLGVRWGCCSGPIWVWWWHFSLAEFISAVILAFLLIIINLRQGDDMALAQKLKLFSLNSKLNVKICGEKATRLAKLKQAGFNIPDGWVLPVSDIKIENPKLPSFDFPVIVRSSAVGEDSDSNSAAGQYLTIGPVYNLIELQDAINNCRASYQRSPAIAYRRQREISDHGMAILIQNYINSQVAGVMFTRNSLDGGSQVIIEALPGSAESVVGGKCTPIHWEIEFSSDTLLEQSLNAIKNNAIKNNPILPLEIIAELVKKAREIETFFHGLPQDIEWCWDGEKIWILQSRPITNLRPIWTRTIAAEVIPGAIHPLTWSINRPLTCGVWGDIFTIVLGKKAVGLDFNETATLLASHAYFNATLLGEIFRMMGLPEQGLEFLLRGQKMGKPPLSQILVSVPGLWRLMQREIKLNQEFNRDLVNIFLPALQQLDNDNIANFTPGELLDRVAAIQKLLKPITYYNILGPIGLAIRTAIFRVNDDYLPKDTMAEIVSVKELEKLADTLQKTGKVNQENNRIFSDELEIAFQNWLNKYGYLSEVGTDISVATWREKPETFRQLLLKMATKPGSINNQQTSSLSMGWWEKWRLNQCWERARVKGKIGEIFTRLLAHLRWTFLAIENYGLENQVLEKKGDIFYLEYKEIQEWVSFGANYTLKDKIRARRIKLEEERDRPVPNVVYGNLIPTGDRAPSFLSPVTSETGILQGIPASIGCVEGYIKICRNVTDNLSTDEKFIMVVPYTDAGWAPLLLNAKAIIAEVGGQLSHGAIIAREYGIPAVMNIPEATTRLQNGQKVRVDGLKGTVEILN